ncbi:hypothetical protein CGMCC3_g15566 [Colletotrichum fructicola]|nr:uncharacterized protein CGMCC3_g15566 [Colletotrichum fructicola]KAE9568322.1 hypothetical protein CGMCC3_g15566 [Colletotrichum fructicola]
MLTSHSTEEKPQHWTTIANGCDCCRTIVPPLDVPNIYLPLTAPSPLSFPLKAKTTPKRAQVTKTAYHLWFLAANWRQQSPSKLRREKTMRAVK